jgi:hypothetical protein
MVTRLSIGWRSTTRTRTPGRSPSEAIRLIFVNPVDFHCFPDGNIGEWSAGRLVDGAVNGGNGIAVRIHVRMAQSGGHALDQRVGYCVLQPLGLLVHCIPGVAQKLHQVSLDETVPAYHAKGSPPPFLGKLDPSVGHMLQKAMLR